MGRSEKPAPGRDRECRARAREDKVSGLFAAHASEPAAFGAGQSGRAFQGALVLTRKRL